MTSQSSAPLTHRGDWGQGIFHSGSSLARAARNSRLCGILASALMSNLHRLSHYCPILWLSDYTEPQRPGRWFALTAATVAGLNAIGVSSSILYYN
jgi:hypothetical protein